MKIGIDIDEVLVEFIKGYLSFYNSKYHSNFKFEDVITYNLWEVLPISREQVFELQEEFYNSDSFDEIKLISGAKEGIIEIAKSNQVFVITSRPRSMKAKTDEFFKKNFKDLKLDVSYSGDVQNLNGKAKAEICKNLNLDLFIEDHVKPALECAEQGIKVFLFDKPWNQKISHENIIRVKNWEEILKKIN